MSKNVGDDEGFGSDDAKHLQRLQNLLIKMSQDGCIMDCSSFAAVLRKSLHFLNDSQRLLRFWESWASSVEDITSQSTFQALALGLFPQERVMLSKFVHNFVNFYPQILPSTARVDNEEDECFDDDDNCDEEELQEMTPLDKTRLAQQAFQMTRFDLALDLFNKIVKEDDLICDQKILLDLCILNCHLGQDDLETSKTILDDLQDTPVDTKLKIIYSLSVKAAYTQLWAKAKYFKVARETLKEVEEVMQDEENKKVLKEIQERDKEKLLLEQELAFFLIPDLPTLRSCAFSKESPLGTCRSEPCVHLLKNNKEVNFVSKRREFYSNDPGLKGYMKMNCTQNCVVVYHQLCFKRLKDLINKHNDKDLIGTNCLTPDCDGLVKKVFRMDKDGCVVKELSDPERIASIISSNKQLKSTNALGVETQNDKETKAARKGEQHNDTFQNTGARAKKGGKKAHVEAAAPSTTMATKTPTTTMKATSTSSKATAATTKMSSKSMTATKASAKTSSSVYRYPSWAEDNQMDEEETGTPLLTAEQIQLPSTRNKLVTMRNINANNDSILGNIPLHTPPYTNFNNMYYQYPLANNLDGAIAPSTDYPPLTISETFDGAMVDVAASGAPSSSAEERIAQLEQQLAQERSLSHSLFLKFSSLTSLVQEERKAKAQLEQSVGAVLQRSNDGFIELRNLALVHWALLVDLNRPMEEQRRAEAYYNVVYNLVDGAEEPTELAQFIASNVDQMLLTTPPIEAKNEPTPSKAETSFVPTVTNTSKTPSMTTSICTKTDTQVQNTKSSAVETEVSSTEKLLRDLGIALNPEDLQEVVNEANIDFTCPRKEEALLDNFPQGAASLELLSASNTNVNVNCFKMEETEECVICFESVESTLSLEILECGHKFHKPCFETWVEKDKSCPICRAYIVQSKDYPPLMQPRRLNA